MRSLDDLALRIALAVLLLLGLGQVLAGCDTGSRQRLADPQLDALASGAVMVVDVATDDAAQLARRLDEPELEPELKPELEPIADRSVGLPLPRSAVDDAVKLATPDVRDAIEEAYAEVDPRRLHPWWRDELYLICKREGRCGREGLVGVHGNDRDGAGRAAWAKAVAAGDLDPVDCSAHAWTPRQWGTRGLFGLNAARGVALLGCVGPEALDDPEVSARLAAQRLVSCPRWFGRECSCIDHTHLWVGLGTFARRPLLGKRSQVVSVARQCGGGVAAWHMVASLGWIFGP